MAYPYDLNFGEYGGPMTAAGMSAVTRQSMPDMMNPSYVADANAINASANPGMFSWLKGDTMQTLFGGQNEQGNFQPGIVSPMLGGMGALFQGWSGLQQSKLAKDALNFQKQAFQTNLANQTRAYNTQLEDQYKARTSDYAGKDKDVAKYMSEHGMKG